MKKKGNKKKVITFRILEPIKNEIEFLAAQEGSTLNAYLLKIVLNDLEKKRNR